MQTVFLFLLFFSSKIGLQGANETLAKEMHAEIIMRDGLGQFSLSYEIYVNPVSSSSLFTRVNKKEEMYGRYEYT